MQGHDQDWGKGEDQHIWTQLFLEGRHEMPLGKLGKKKGTGTEHEAEMEEVAVKRPVRGLCMLESGVSSVLGRRP